MPERRMAPGRIPGYARFLDDIKTRIREAQIRAGLSANAELIRLYWGIGRDIVARQKDEGWGSAVVERLSADIQRAFPGIAGFSITNIRRMRAFYLSYAGITSNLPQVVGESGPRENPPQPVGELGGEPVDPRL